MKTKHITPLRAIRKYCLWCCNEQFPEIKYCSATDCMFHSRRFGRGGGRLLRLIRLKCLECSGNNMAERKRCRFYKGFDEQCVLYPYRMGKRPKQACS